MGNDYVNSALLEAFTTSQLLLNQKVAEGVTLTLFRKAAANHTFHSQDIYDPELPLPSSLSSTNVW